MRRRLFNLAAAVSLVLCVISLLLLPVSCSIKSPDYAKTFEVDFKPTSGWHDYAFVRVESGKLTFWRDKLDEDGLTDYLAPDPRLREVHYPGVRYKSSPRYSETEIQVTIPLWALSLLFVLLPFMFAVRMVRLRRRVQQQRCLVCGYDLRASPERCPECGTAVTRPATPV